MSIYIYIYIYVYIYIVFVQTDLKTSLSQFTQQNEFRNGKEKTAGHTKRPRQNAGALCPNPKGKKGTTRKPQPKR